jgi:hypothetical protein
MIDPIFALAQLRHLYENMVNGRVTNCPEAAKGLLGPSIESFERLIQRIPGNLLAEPKEVV